MTDADLQAYYNAHKADYHVDEQVKDQIRKGADFATLAKANSQDPGSKDAGVNSGM